MNPQSPANETLRDEAQLLRMARRRVAMRTGLYTHALVYLCVNSGLIALNLWRGQPYWFFGPLLGWGLGLSIHALVVTIKLNSFGLHEKMLAKEVERLRRHAGSP